MARKTTRESCIEIFGVTWDWHKKRTAEAFEQELSDEEDAKQDSKWLKHCPKIKGLGTQEVPISVSLASHNILNS